MSETYDIGSGDSKKTLTTYTSMQNLNLYNALSLNSIASAVNVYVSALIKLMTEDAVMRNPTTADQ
jgi:hypothetical protein